MPILAIFDPLDRCEIFIVIAISIAPVILTTRKLRHQGFNDRGPHSFRHLLEQVQDLCHLSLALAGPFRLLLLLHSCRSFAFVCLSLSVLLFLLILELHERDLAH